LRILPDQMQERLPSLHKQLAFPTSDNVVLSALVREPGGVVNDLQRDGKSIAFIPGANGAFVETEELPDSPTPSSSER
jgi:hypothetical protein